MSLSIKYSNKIYNTEEIIFIPVVRSSEKTYTYTTTRHPVERGEEIADHRTKKPLKLVVNVMIPNKEVSKWVLFWNAIYDDSTEVSKLVNFSNKKDVINSLIYLSDNDEIVDVKISGEGVYYDMVIENVNYKEDMDSADVYRVEITFAHVKLVSPVKGVIPDEIKAKLSKDKQNNQNDASGTNNKGQENSTPAEAVFKSNGGTVYPQKVTQYSDTTALANKYKNNSGLQNPLPGYQQTSGFSARINPVNGRTEFHKGIDIAAPFGTNIKSAGTGKVLSYGNFRDGYGNCVIIDHGNGLITKYNHLSYIPAGISIGASVDKNTVIGKVGSTGMSTGNHLDFQVMDKNTRIPLPPRAVVKGC